MILWTERALRDGEGLLGITSKPTAGVVLYGRGVGQSVIELRGPRQTGTCSHTHLDVHAARRTPGECIHTKQLAGVSGLLISFTDSCL